MSYDSTPKSSGEIVQPLGQELILQSQGVQIDLAAPPLIPKADALQKGLNGDILATFTLPEGNDPDVPAKEFAVLDCGPDTSPETPVPVFVFEGRPVKLIGMARTRYGLYALNHSPREHMSSYAPVGEGENGAAHIGTEQSEINYKLGLNDRGTANANTAQNQVVIATYEGKLIIFDESGTGTKVKIATERQSESQSYSDIEKESADITARVYQVEAYQRGDPWSPNRDGEQVSSNNLKDILATNRQMYDLLHANIAERDMTYTGIPEALRTNPDLRKNVATFLSTTAQLLVERGTIIPKPDIESLKKPVDSTSHIKDMSTADYALLLALKKLDGTFDPTAMERGHEHIHDDSWRFGSAVVADRTSDYILKSLAGRY